jgi:hypothetical protein
MPAWSARRSGLSLRRGIGMPAGLHGRVQQHRQMRLDHIGPVGLVRNRQAEETGETDGFDTRIDAFERPPEHLGTHIDAEGRLERGTVLDFRRPVKLGDQAALMGAVGGILQDGEAI